MSGTSAPAYEQVQEQTQNNQYSTVDKDEHAWRLTHVERDIDVVRATVEQMEANLMHQA